MATINLGMVTAYAYAVAGGYTGTEAQFETLLGDIATTLNEFENFSVTVTTLPAGSSATASYNNGVLSLGIPKGDKGDKGDTGDTGATGATGATPDFSIGTVTTLNPTDSATATITGTAEEPVLNLGIPKGAAGDVNMSQIQSILPKPTVSGSIASFTDGADSIPMPSVVASIEAVQSGSGDPSPNNVRPISGWSQVETTRAGKNLCPTSTVTGVTWATSSASLLSAINGIPTAGTYTLSFDLSITAVSNTGIWAYGLLGVNSNGNLNKTVNMSSNPTVGYTAQYTYTFTLTDSQIGTFTGCYLYGCGNNNDGAIGTATFDNIQIEVGSSATTYQEYVAPTTYTTSLGSTYYGGTLDVVSGVLTVTHEYVDLGTMNWNWTDAYKLFFACVDDQKVSLTSATPNAICSQYPKMSFNTLGYDFTIAEGFTMYKQSASATGYVDIRDTSKEGMTTAQFKTSMSGVYVAYELATPTTVQLTGQEIDSLLYNNNVWCDSGSIEVTYCADIKTYIDNATA